LTSVHQNRNRNTEEQFLERAVDLASLNVTSKRGGPFGCVIVQNGKIIARGANSVTRTHDPTAHAEMVAIRKACKKLKSFQLDECLIFSSCEPCPMCLGAIYWARPKALYFASEQHDAARVGFDDAFIYEELKRPLAKRKLKTVQIKKGEHLQPFRLWAQDSKKIKY
jgi:tRNA(Arg) A34 adenosine deaminase TadA